MKKEEIKNESNVPQNEEKISPLIINEIEYIYSVTKLKEKEGVTIKLFESKPKTNIYYLYEADIEKLTKDIKVLLICEDLEEMIATLIDTFNERKVTFLEQENKYYLELKFGAIGKTKTSKIELTKYKQKDKLSELSDKINELENEYNKLNKEIEDLKKKEENKNDMDLEDKIKQILDDKEIKMKLFEEFEQLIDKKYMKKEENNMQENLEEKDENEIKDNKSEFTEKLEEKFEEKINSIKEEFNQKMNELNNLTLQIKDISNNLDVYTFKNKKNYIELKLDITEDDIGKNISIIRQSRFYKYYSNFEIDDIEIIIDNMNVPIKCKEYYSIKDIPSSILYSFFWIFEKEGIHTVKIIFRKKLFACDRMFEECDHIIEIDCSNFDCSQIIDCNSMFCNCISLQKINLGDLDFPLSENFSFMFYGCEQLKKLDVSHFNTQNSLSFKEMFRACCQLKIIDVSKFNSSKCQNINKMFYECNNLTEINMLNWDMHNIQGKDYNAQGKKGLGKIVDILSSISFSKDDNILNKLFYGCTNLKSIKMSANNTFEDFSDEESYIFYGLPKNGSFTYKKDNKCNKLLRLLPPTWNIQTV